MAISGGKIGEGHLVSAAYFWVQVMHSTGKAIRRQPLGQRRSIQKSAVDFLRRSPEYTVETDRIWHRFAGCQLVVVS